MIIYNREDKKLVLPSSLGNFGNAGGGSGSGLTPAEVAEIASAVTEAAIEEYDTEIQVDLEEIRDAISGNTDTLLDLAVIAAMSVADRVALFDEVFEKASNGERIYIKGLVQEETVRTAVLPLVSYRPEANPVLHQGGNLYFAAKGDTDNIYFHIALTSEGSVDPTAGNIIKRNIYNLPTASAEVKGGVRIGSGLTMAQDVISVDTTGLVTDGDLAPFVAELSAATGDLAALSGSVNDIRSDVGTLSGATNNILSDIETLSGQTTANTSDITALSAATEAISSKADAAASGLATLSGSTEALSGATVALESGIGAANTNIEALSGITESVSGAVDTLSGITEGVVSDMAELSAAAAKNYFVDWSALYDMDYAPRRAAFIELSEKRNEGYTIYASGKTAANGYDVILPLVDFIQGTWSVDRYNGGWAKFGGICESGDTSGYYGASFNSAGNINPNARYFSKTDFYTLKNATASSLGGIKVGSGLTMGSDDKLSVNIGEGLAFSGNTLVVSGISGGGGNVFVIYDIWAQNTQLADFLFQYTNNGSISSGFPEDTRILLWLGQDFQGAFDSHSQGFVELYPSEFKDVEGTDVFFLGGVYANSDTDAYAVRVGYTAQGYSSNNWVERIRRDIAVYKPAFVRFGNDERGYLIYDADNDRFEYNNGYVATGDTTTVCPDLIDKLFTNYIFDGGDIWTGAEYLYPLNTNKFYVKKNGETTTYAAPRIKRKQLASTVTIDGVNFDWEITYDYGDWILTAYYAGNEANDAANLRITGA